MSIFSFTSLVVILAAIFAGQQMAFAQSSDTTTACTSTFHLTTITSVVSNPPLSPADIAILPEPASHFQLDCVTIDQSFPVSSNRKCASPPNQRLQLCTTPTEGSGAGTWTCQDASQYLTTQFSQMVVGTTSGPTLRIKLTWKSSLTDVDCYPRTFTVSLVGLDVPEPGTRVGASVAFVVVVAVVASAALGYGFYALWRVSKRFEHRENSNERALDSPAAAGAGAANGPQETYRKALQALGAPPNLASLYDEEEDHHNRVPSAVVHHGDDGDEELYDIDEERQQQQQYHHQNRRGDDDYDYDDEGADDDYYDDDENDIDEKSPLSHRRQQRHNNQNNGPTHAVLDNNQVVESTAAPVPWFQRLDRDQQQEQQHQHQQNRRVGGGRAPDHHHDPHNSSVFSNPGGRSGRQQQQRY